MKQRFSSLLIISLVIIGSFSGGYVFSNNSQGVTINANDQEPIEKEVKNEQGSVDLELFWEVWNKIENEYAEPNALDNEEALYGAIRGMVRSIDDSYTVFMSPKEAEEFQHSLDGELEGIGAELSADDGKLVVVSPLKNSPAEKAGLLPKDIIYKIDGKLANEMTLFEAITAIRGTKGTTVVLTIIREGKDDTFDIEIVRSDIEIESVTYELLGNKVAYVSINQFSDSSTDEFLAIASQVIDDSAKGLILDLRYNGGGYLNIAVDITSELIEGKKKVVTLKKRNQKENQVFYTNGSARLAKLPLVVLINQGSASASEILAGAIQDHQRGFVIGEQSYGKGSVQEIIPLDNGAKLRMTVAKWLTPNDRDINNVGVAPDMEIKSNKEPSEDKDPQLDAAKDYINNLLVAKYNPS